MQAERPDTPPPLNKRQTILRPRTVVVVLAIAAALVLGSIYVHRDDPAPVQRDQSSEATRYPLAASANRRYLVDQDGKPQFMAADTAWNLFARLTPSEAAHYLDVRKSQGFNTILVSVIDNVAGGIDGSSTAGQSPFIGDDIGTPNPAYFDNVDVVLGLARDRGMQLVIAPAWLTVARYANSYTTASTTAYGTWLGHRYRGVDNIIWMVGGDAGDASDPCPKQAETRALATALKAADPRHLMTYHPSVGTASSACYGGDGWLDINADYWDFDFHNPVAAYRLVSRDYGSSPTRPTIMIETGYEGPFLRDPDPDALNARTSRWQSFWMASSGAFGFTYGAQSTHAMANGHPNFSRTWQETLTIPGGAQQGHIADFFNGLPWWQLVPDQDHRVLTSGYGTFGASDYATAARAADGSSVAAYLPTSRTVTVDMSRLAGRSTARWFDPTNGTYSDAGTDLPNRGTRQFAAPARNSAGDSDFGLVITSGR